MQDEREDVGYASPPCFMHELSPDYSIETVRQDCWTDVLRWRKAERKRLIAERLALSADEREARSNRIAVMLDRALGNVSGRIVGAYWPFRGEPDLRNWSIRLLERGGRIALPVVVQKGWPLEYRIWSPGDPLERGVWNILVPSRGPAVQPSAVIAPLVGFDQEHYRLGYGGGFFDRTLAAMAKKPLTIGVGYAHGRLPTIYPQPHDIPMDIVITE
ncbi:5-formyltetrahydrofolate cyclo-ligase [Pseudaminobacter sp. 19-2017]|uniref:5-formyltetrahydrofolate cyclo-ligase n=1 Tax=Pseudaminobacter soli (ex Zhang et al. 2022) TaxID=2831468 RepID=A0A942DWR8_9HYPH|nr:5-formyltetrahydrofolate cyclo-ligase [Pseudaminobacter soli]MBS3648478.1 5-formyltetrahydrofolate cyclo-ligase [Pseudaminobacter soli]